MRHHFLLLSAFSLIIQACQSNEIYFDPRRQQVCSSNSKGIKQLIIKNATNAECYRIIWSDSNNKAPKCVSLAPISKDYTIKGGWKDTNIKHDQFKLRNNGIYIIERGQGDAAKCAIEIKTDNNGHISRQN